MEDDSSAWILYFPALIVFGIYACVRFSEFLIMMERSETDDNIVFVTQLGTIVCSPMCFIGWLIYVAHQMPYLRFELGGTFSGSITEIGSLLTQGQKRDKMVYFSDGYVDKPHAFTFWSEWQYETCQCVEWVYEKDDEGEEEKTCVKTTCTMNTDYASFSVAPVFASMEDHQYGGPILGWAVPYEDKKHNQNIDADICPEGGEKEEARGGLCGTYAQEKDAWSAAGRPPFVSKYKLHGTLIFGWLMKFNTTVQWSQYPEATNREVDEVFKFSTLKDLPVFIFKDPAKQQWNIGWWCTAGLVVFTIGSVCSACTSLFNPVYVMAVGSQV